MQNTQQTAVLPPELRPPSPQPVGKTVSQQVPPTQAEPAGNLLTRAAASSAEQTQDGSVSQPCTVSTSQSDNVVLPSQVSTLNQHAANTEENQQHKKKDQTEQAEELTQKETKNAKSKRETFKNYNSYS